MPKIVKKIKISEKKIEKKLVEEVKKLGGVAYKFVSPSHRSVPDRLILLPSGRFFFVECKTTGAKPTELQKCDHTKIRSLGFQVFIVDDYEGITECLK